MSVQIEPGMESRKKSYKSSGAMESTEGRRKRMEETMARIRKAKRDDALAKRRAQGSSLSNDFNLLENLPSMVEQVWSKDPSLQLEATIQFRKLLATDTHPPIEEVIKAGVVPRFVDFLIKEDLPQIQYEAAWIMTNISFGTSEQIQVGIENGVIPKLIQLLDSPNISIREQAVWALGNITGDSPSFRDLVLMHGGLLPILSQFNLCTTPSMIQNATWVLGNFFRGKPSAPFEQVKIALPMLKQLSLSNDPEVLKDACWALCNLSSGTNEKIEALIDIGICSRLIEILRHHSSSAVIMPVLTTIGNIAGTDDYQAQLLIENGVLSCLFNFITKDIEAKIKKEACWAVSNITSTNKDNIQAVINANLIQPLVLLSNSAESDIKIEAALAISNALCRGSFDQIRVIASQGCMEPLCNLLSCSDTRTVFVCLQGLESILKVGETDKNLGVNQGVNVYALYMDHSGCLERIEALQEHGNNDIYKKAITILETYWDDYEDR